MKAPAWARALLRRAVPEERRDDVLGDLEEVHLRRRRRLGAPAAWLATSIEALLVAGAFQAARWRRDEWTMTRWVTWSEVRLGLRWILKQPVMAATAVLAMAVGIGLATTGVAVLEATVFAELPIPGGERFVRLRAYAQPGGRTEIDLERYHLFAEQADAFEHVGAIGAERVNLIRRSGDVEPVRAALVTPRSFAAVPGVPVLGRTLLPADAQPGAAPVALVRESLWRRKLGADPGAIGTAIDVAGVERTVVGVMPDGYEFPARSELWLPLDDRTLGGSVDRPRPGLVVFGVLREGVAPATAREQIEALSARLAAERAAATDPEIRVAVVPYTETPEGWELMITVLITVLVLVLIVIASNVAHLIAARTAARSAELAVRTALGARRSRLVGQLTVEVALLGAVAAVLGLAGSGAALGRLGVLLSGELPFWIDFAPGGITLAFVVGITLLAVVVAGVVPALEATRRDPAGNLRAAGPGGGGARLGRLGSAMVVIEMALSVALLSAALVMARGFANSTDDDLDLPRGQILTAWINEPPEAHGGGPDNGAATKAALAAAARALPGVAAGAVATHLPRADPPARLTELAPEPGERPAAPVAAPVAGVGPGYFAVLGADALAGRVFRDEDFAPGAPAVAVVNQPFVDRFLGGRNPIGRRLRRVDPEGAEAGAAPASWREIVGVVPDLGLSVADPASAAGYYVPIDGGRTYYYLALRTAGVEPMALAAPLRRAFAGVDPGIDARRVVPLERVGWEDRAFMSGFGSALTALGGMALLLSLAGIYAMLSFAVTRRTREIGIRVALGATGRQVLRSVVGSTALRLLAGAVLGAALALVLMRAKAMLVTRLPAGEPWVLPSVLALLLVAGVAASWSPTRRALGIQPGEALRVD